MSNHFLGFWIRPQRDSFQSESSYRILLQTKNTYRRALTADMFEGFDETVLVINHDAVVIFIRTEAKDHCDRFVLRIHHIHVNDSYYWILLRDFASIAMFWDIQVLLNIMLWSHKKCVYPPNNKSTYSAPRIIWSARDQQIKFKLSELQLKRIKFGIK